MRTLRDCFVGRKMRCYGFVAATIPLVVSPQISLAVTLACQGLDITVTAPDSKLANRVCGLAAASLDLLAHCHLQQTDPVSITVNSIFPPDFDDCFGVFHCDDDLVQVLTPDALSEAIQRSGNFKDLPLDVLFDSLITHEVSHALAFQSSIGTPRTAVEVEYIAYAMQMQSLPEYHRNAFIAAHPVTEPILLLGLNDIILSFSPEVFAVKVWTHFQSEGNGCEFIHRILNHEVLFPLQ